MTSYSSTFRILAIVAFFAFASSGFAQVNVTNTMTPFDLVQNVLAGPGVTISNVTYNGVPSPATPQLGSGEFTTINSNLGLPAGIVLSTGDATQVGQAATGFSSNTNNTGTDVDLQAISGGTINDAAVLEFDFIPTGDSLKFNYVFGSEEYPEFVCSFNDAFGFFLSGPGIAGPYSNGAINIALVPNTTTPVSINNINNGLNNNPNDPSCPATNPQYYVDNSVGTTVIWDGFTTVLQAKAQVICGQTYHIKLAVGDALDNAWDSGVFLEAGSFTATAIQVEVSGAVSSDSSIVEGCSQAVMSIIRPDTVGIDTVIYDIGGSAINGVDYNLINDTVIFASGTDTIDIVIQPIDDGIPDGPDTLIITTYSITPCGDTIIDVGVLFIVDSIPFLLDAPDITIICPTDSVPLSAISLGDPQDYTYVWSTGFTEVSSTGSSVNVVMPPGTQDYIVTAYDTCGNSSSTDTITITLNIPPPLLATASNDTTTTCAGQPANLSSSGADGTPPYTYSWSSGANSASTTVNPASTTTYYVTITDLCGDTSVDSVLVSVVPQPPTINLSNDTTLLCPGDGVVLTADALGAPPYGYTWSTGQPTNTIFVFPPVGTTYYVVGVTDACNAIPVLDSVAVTVPSYPPLDAGLSNQSVTCPGDPVTLNSNISGGAGGYTWVWSNGSSNASINVNPNTTTSYSITVTDQCGSDTTQNVTVDVPVYNPVQISVAGDDLICLGESSTLLSTTTEGAGGYSWVWTGVGVNQQGQGVATVTPASAIVNTYTVTATDQCGESASTTYDVTAEVCEISPPNVFSPNGDGSNDFLIISNIEKFPNNRVEIYNRWGKKVFEANGYNNDWDGGDVSDGTYFMIVTLNETKEPYSGHVTIIR